MRVGAAEKQQETSMPLEPLDERRGRLSADEGRWEGLARTDTAAGTPLPLGTAESQRMEAEAYKKRDSAALKELHSMGEPVNRVPRACSDMLISAYEKIFTVLAL